MVLSQLSPFPKLLCDQEGIRHKDLWGPLHSNSGGFSQPPRWISERKPSTTGRMPPFHRALFPPGVFLFFPRLPLRWLESLARLVVSYRLDQGLPRSAALSHFPQQSLNSPWRSGALRPVGRFRSAVPFSAN